MSWDPEWLLGFFSRLAHILAAIVAVGGTIFARFVVMPTLDELPPDQRATLHASMRTRWATFVHAAILFLLASGLYNIAIISTQFRMPVWYNVVFGIKFLLAMGIFTVASLLIGRSEAADQVRRNAKFWMNLNVAMAVTLVMLSAVLRGQPKIPKNFPQPSRPSPHARPMAPPIPDRAP